MSLTSFGPLEEGLLIRYLDGVADEHEARRVEAARATRPEVRATLDGLEEASIEFGRLVGAVEVPRPPGMRDEGVTARHRRPFSPGRRRAAAAVVLLAVGAVAVSPAGAAFAQRFAAWLGLESPAPPAGEPVVAPAAATVSFLPAGDTLRIEVATAPSSAVLERIGGEQATVRIDEGSRARLLVVRGGLHIAVDDAAPWGLRLGVPSGISTVQLRVGQGPWRRLDIPPR